MGIPISEKSHSPSPYLSDAEIPASDTSDTSEADIRIPISAAIPDRSSPERNCVAPGQPSKNSENRVVKIETASELMAEIRWCLGNGGYFLLLRSFVPPQQVGYFLEHRDYNYGKRQVKTALAKELIERKAIRSDSSSKGTREFYIWDDRAFPKLTAKLSDSQTSSASAIAEPEQDTALQSASQLSDTTPEFPDWMTAKQAFEFLGGDPDDRDSSVSSANGLKQIRFCTFKSKTSSELKPFGLELNQDRKRQRHPCYRLLKPNPKSKS